MTMPPNPSPEDMWARERRALRAAARTLGRLFRQDARDRSRATIFVRAGLVLIGAFLAGLAQFLPEARVVDGGATFPWNAVVGWVGVSLALAGGVWSLVGEQTAPRALEHARRILDEARDAALRFQQERSEAEQTAAEQDQYAQTLRDDADWFVALYSLAVTFRGLIERQLSERPQATDEDVATMFKGVSRLIRKLVEFDAGELWTIAVFRLHGPGELAEGRLVCIADARADRDSEVRDHRTWGTGEGVAGQVLVTGTEIVVHDSSDKAYHWLHVPTAKTDDEKRYRSLIGIPILVGSGNRLWGVVVATSDRKNRFRIDHLAGATQGSGNWEMEPLRLLAGMVALLLAPSQITDPPAVPAPDKVKPAT